MTAPSLILASQSASRRRMLSDACVPFALAQSLPDEETHKATLLAAGAGPHALARFKALEASAAHPGALVLGCDQTLELDDGSRVGKCADIAAARALLLGMAGRPHQLHAAAAVARDGALVWTHTETVTMHMRPLSEAFVDAYLATDWEQCRWCVGCYRIEGPGAQLFSAIDGSLFGVQGLPLLPLLDFLRGSGVLTA